MISNSKSKFQPFLELIAKPFMWINPNVITVVSFFISTLFLYFIIAENYIGALIIFAFACFDSVDGTVARATGKESRFGGVLDSSLDRITDAFMIMSFGFAEVIDWALILAVLIFSYMISYIRSRAELAGDGKFKLAVGIVERPERLFMILLTVLYLLFDKVYDLNWSLWNLEIPTLIFIVMLILSIVTVMQRFIAAYERLK